MSETGNNHNSTLAATLANAVNAVNAVNADGIVKMQRRKTLPKQRVNFP